MVDPPQLRVLTLVQARGMTAGPIVMSDLLNDPAMQILKQQGQLITDRCAAMRERILLMQVSCTEQRRARHTLAHPLATSVPVWGCCGRISKDE